MADVVQPAKICGNYDPEMALLWCSWKRFSVKIDRCCVWISCWKVIITVVFDKFTESLQSLNHFPTLVVETCKDRTDCISESVTLHSALSSANIRLVGKCAAANHGYIILRKVGQGQSLEGLLPLFLATRKRPCQYALVEYDFPGNC